MSQVVKLKVDLTTGLFEVEAPLESLEELLARVEQFIPRLASARGEEPPPNESRTSTRKRAPKRNSDKVAEPTPKLTTAMSKKTHQQRRPRKTADLGVVAELNLRPEGKQSLREFHEEKSPGSNEKRFAVIVYYFTRVLSVDAVALNHIYTALKDLGLKVPTRLSTVMSNSSKRHGWIDTKNRDDIKLTIRGENFVEHDLPEASGSDKS